MDYELVINDGPNSRQNLATTIIPDFHCFAASQVVTVKINLSACASQALWLQLNYVYLEQVGLKDMYLDILVLKTL
jgi:hypothetical protein